MANLIQATVYQIDGAPLPSPITIDFQTSGILIKNASINIPSVNSAIQVYNNPSNPVWFKTYYVAETIDSLTSAANQGVSKLIQATVLEINNDPQGVNSPQFSFPSQEVLVIEAVTPSTGVNSIIQFKGVSYSVSETQSELFSNSTSSPGINLYNYYNLY